MTEIKSERAYNHVGVWYDIMQSKWRYFWGVLVSLFIDLENVGEGNGQ